MISVAREGREAAENWKTIPHDGTRLRKAFVDSRQPAGRHAADAEPAVSIGLDLPLRVLLPTSCRADQPSPVNRPGSKPRVRYPIREELPARSANRWGCHLRPPSPNHLPRRLRNRRTFPEKPELICLTVLVLVLDQPLALFGHAPRNID